jgi:hypothetical protein
VVNAYLANPSSSARAMLSASTSNFEVDILHERRMSNAFRRIEGHYIHSLPLGPRLCCVQSGLVIDRVELSVVSENHVMAFGFRDWSDVFFPTDKSCR